MPEPNEYLALKNLQAALEGIHVDDGYHFTVAALAVKLDANHDIDNLILPTGPRPFVILEVLDDRWEYFPASEVRLVVPVRVHWVSESIPEDDNSRMQTFFRGCADVEKAIAVDVGRGGSCSDTRIMRRLFDTAVDGAQVWAILELELRLRRTYGTPNGIP